MWWGRNAKQVMAEYRERQNIQIKKQSVYLKQSQVLGTRITDKYKSKQFFRFLLRQDHLFLRIVYIKQSFWALYSVGKNWGISKSL